MGITCSNCGIANTRDSEFCKKCGTRITASDEVSVPTQTIESPRGELTTGSTFAGRFWYGDYYAKSFFHLGTIFEKLGDTAKTKEHYEKFLDLWKDADPEMAEVDDARKRLAGL